MKEKNIKETTKVLKAMAHPLRLKILCVLRDNELAVYKIVDQVGTCQSNVSQHLYILKINNIVELRRNGNKTLYRVKNKKILKFFADIQAVFAL